MLTKMTPIVSALVLCLAGAFGPPCRAQETDKGKDEALDSLIEKLAAPRDSDGSQTDKTAAGKKGSADAERQASPARAGREQQEGTKPGQGPGGKPGKPAAPRSADSGNVAPKDQEVDDLLEKLGETHDAPTAEGRPRGQAGADEPKGSAREAKPAAPKLGEKDKAIDERLEEYTGRRRKRPADDEERKGPIGEIIKEMKDVEKRLGKPDPSESTRSEQKQIVKRIETLIEQARQSGSAARQLVMRRVRQQGQGGQQEGDQPGAQARGAPPMKPAKPTSQHSTAGGKDVWGHLPPELRDMMENSFKEEMLSSKSELISRYFRSISEGKVTREE